MRPTRSPLRDAADAKPVDIDRAVRLGTELARKQGLDVGADAVAYATDGLRSKIERDAVYNPVTAVYSAFMSYAFLKKQRGGRNVAYRDRRKALMTAPDAALAPSNVVDFPAPKAEAERKAEQPKQREPMFKRIGLLKAKPREWLIGGFLPRNEACNPFGRPDLFKGVTAAQLCVHIAGGVPFLGMDVKQAPTAYFAAERGEQVKRRIKGHIQRLGLPDDLPCYFGDRPVNLLNSDDVKLMFEEIKAMERDAGAPIGFLVVDTQSRTQDGDENSTKDGAKYAAAVEALRRHTSITPWIIAHIGHAETAQDRPRGSSTLLGAYDVFYKFKKVDETHGSIRITIDRDGLGQKEFAFVVELFAHRRRKTRTASRLWSRISSRTRPSARRAR